MSNSNQTFRGKASLELQGDRELLTAETSTTPGTLQTLISYTVAASKRFISLDVSVSCSLEGQCTVFKNSDLIVSLRTHGACPNALVQFLPWETFEAGDILEVKYLAPSYRPATGVESFVQGRLITL